MLAGCPKNKNLKMSSPTVFYAEFESASNLCHSMIKIWFITKSHVFSKAYFCLVLHLITLSIPDPDPDPEDPDPDPDPDPPGERGR